MNCSTLTKISHSEKLWAQTVKEVKQNLKKNKDENFDKHPELYTEIFKKNQEKLRLFRENHNLITSEQLLELKKLIQIAIEYNFLEKLRGSSPALSQFTKTSPNKESFYTPKNNLFLFQNNSKPSNNSNESTRLTSAGIEFTIITNNEKLQDILNLFDLQKNDNDKYACTHHENGTTTIEIWDHCKIIKFVLSQNGDPEKLYRENNIDWERLLKINNIDYAQLSTNSHTSRKPT